MRAQEVCLIRQTFYNMKVWANPENRASLYACRLRRDTRLPRTSFGFTRACRPAAVAGPYLDGVTDLRHDISVHTRAFWAATAAVTVGSVGLRLDGATPDVSWLTSMCERMLDGEKGWIDIFETTPPVPTLLYMPGALLSRLAGVGAEVAVFATAYTAALFALSCA